MVNEEQLTRLRRYQASMLKETYRDLAEDENDKRLLEFILDTIYIPSDIGEPEETFGKVYDYFTSKPRGRSITILKKLRELYRLSDELDRALAQKIGEGVPSAGGGDPEGRSGGGHEITDAAYTEALRACNDRRERERHIELFVECITSLHELTRHPLNAFVFKVIKLLMSYIGRPQAVRTVEKGYNAFLGVKDISRFTDTIKERELERLERVYGG